MAALLDTIQLESEADTTALAIAVGAVLCVGDVLLLEGEVGAGKTFFARHLIQSLLHTPEDVPSPTFTLVQTYDTQKGEILHADLYRLSSPEEIDELGLIEAFETSICLIEWPDRLGENVVREPLTLKFETGEKIDQRKVSFYGSKARWADRIKGVNHDHTR